jgi:hypothetical protein
MTVIAFFFFGFGILSECTTDVMAKSTSDLSFQTGFEKVEHFKMHTMYSTRTLAAVALVAVATGDQPCGMPVDPSMAAIELLRCGFAVARNAVAPAEVQHLRGAMLWFRETEPELYRNLSDFNLRGNRAQTQLPPKAPFLQHPLVHSSWTRSVVEEYFAVSANFRSWWWVPN